VRLHFQLADDRFAGAHDFLFVLVSGPRVFHEEEIKSVLPLRLLTSDRWNSFSKALL